GPETIDQLPTKLRHLPAIGDGEAFLRGLLASRRSRSARKRGCSNPRCCQSHPAELWRSSDAFFDFAMLTSSANRQLHHCQTETLLADATCREPRWTSLQENAVCSRLPSHDFT